MRDFWTKLSHMSLAHAPCISINRYHAPAADRSVGGINYSGNMYARHLATVSEIMHSAVGLPH